MRSYRLMITVVVSILVVNSAGSASATVRCASMFSFDHEYVPSVKDLDEWLTSTQRLTESTASAEPQFPMGFKTVSRMDQIRNEIFFRIFKWSTSPKYANWKNGRSGQFLNWFGNLVKRASKSPISYFVKGSVFRSLEKILNHDSLPDGTGEKNLKIFSDFMMDYFSEIKMIQDKFGGDLLKLKSEQAQGAIDSFAVKLFAHLNGHEIFDKDAVHAIALLHPLLDSAMDRGHFSSETAQKLKKFLIEGGNPVASNSYEQIVFEYLKRLENAFPRQKSQGFWLTLDQLFQAQLTSLRQKSDKLSAHEHFEIALKKGGLTFVVFAYTAFGKLTVKQFEYFFRVGGVFQLLDDLLDIKKDQSDQINTIWTQETRSNGSHLKPLKALLAIQTDLEGRIKDLSRDFDNPDAFITSYLFAFKLALLGGLSKNWSSIDPETKALLENRFDLTPRTFMDIMRPQSEDLNKFEEGSDLWFLNVLTNMMDSY